VKMAEIIWEAAEPCPPWCRGRHWNGGDYHEAVRIERYRRGKYRVVLTDTREVFPSDVGGHCVECGFEWAKNSTQHWCGLSRAAALAQAQSIADRWERVE
jgi:hypothetical protein